jgi:hypothetical protein
MKITVNGKDFTDGKDQPLENKPRLKWSDIGRFGGIPTSKITSKMRVSVTLPGDKAKELAHGSSLVIVDGMAITVQA